MLIRRYRTTDWFRERLPTELVDAGTGSIHPITPRVFTSREPAQVTECGPSVTRDNPGQRLEDSDRRWSRHERLLDAVDLTEYAGYVGVGVRIGTGVTGWSWRLLVQPARR